MRAKCCLDLAHIDSASVFLCDVLIFLRAMRSSLDALDDRRRFLDVCEGAGGVAARLGLAMMGEWFGSLFSEVLGEWIGLVFGEESWREA